MSDDALKAHITKTLRVPSKWGDEDARTTSEFVMRRALERARDILRHYDLSGTTSPRVCVELLIRWQQLERFAPEAPFSVRRGLTLERLREIVTLHREQLLAHVATAFKFQVVLDGLAAYVERVGICPQSWDEDDARTARHLLSDIDDILLCEGAVEALGGALPAELADQIQDLAVAASEAADSLCPPAAPYIQGMCSLLDVSMLHATGSYPLWLNLATSYRAWLLWEWMVGLAARAADESLSHHR